MTKQVQVCVFAYNLCDVIVDGLASILEQSGNYSCQVYVMINGCTDDTYEKVFQFSLTHQNVIPVQIALGDKSNAWNEFVYQYYKPDNIAVFVDGDLSFGKDAINNIIDYHLENPKYNAISSFPWEGGRSSKKWRDDLLKEHQFTGNLYVLSPDFLTRILEQRVKLPVGLIGDDSMLGYLSATDVCSGTDLPKQRIGVCQSAIFYYPRLNPFSISDIKLYLRRRVRYALREMQQNLIVANLKRDGIAAMPEFANQGLSSDNIPYEKGIINSIASHFALHKIKQNS